MEHYDAKHPSFRLLFLITTPKLADRASELFQMGALPVQYRLNAEGTASNEIMDLLGLGSIDKNLLLSTMPKVFADEMLKKLKKELKLGTVNSGVAFTVPLSGVNAFVLRMMESLERIDLNRNGKDGGSMNDTKEEKYTVIAAIVNQGFSADVMEAAKPAGASGGTVLKGRHIGHEEAANFWGCSVQEEKEIVLILCHAEQKVSIMREICEKCGVRTEAKGVVLSLPVDSMIGLPDTED